MKQEEQFEDECPEGRLQSSDENRNKLKAKVERSTRQDCERERERKNIEEENRK